SESYLRSDPTKGLRGTVAKLVPAPHKVDLRKPDNTMMLQVVKTICFISNLAISRPLPSAAGEAKPAAAGEERPDADADAWDSDDEGGGNATGEENCRYHSWRKSEVEPGAARYAGEAKPAAAGEEKPDAADASDGDDEGGSNVGENY
ncbi:unnamed protein product, partial [Closterium sp. NIES-54]